MKTTRLLILISAFLVMVAVIMNLLNVLEFGMSKIGIYIEVLVLFIHILLIASLHFYEKRINKKDTC